MKINWTQKLTSRKFWMAVAAFVVGVLALFGSDANTTQQISGVIMSLGAVVAYIAGEGLVDASAASTTSTATKYTGQIVGTVDTATADGVVTGADQASQ